MRQFSTFGLVLVLISLVCVAPPASATIIFQDSMETHLVDGTLMTTLSPPTGLSYTQNTEARIASASTDPAPGFTNSGKFVAIPGSTTQPGLRLNHDSAGTAGQVVTSQVDFYMPTTTGTAKTMQFYVNGATSPYGEPWQLWVNGNTGRMGDYITSAWTLTDRGAFTRDAWVSLKVVTDYGTSSYVATVGSVTWSGTFIPGQTGFTGGQKDFQVGTPSTTGFTGYVDNPLVYVGIIPEPSTLVLLAVGLLGLLCYAWRRRR